MKKIKVKLKDIKILNTGMHNAQWIVLGTHQGFIGKNELKKILFFKERGLIYKKRLINKIKKETV